MVDTRMKIQYGFVTLLLVLAGCGGSQQFVAMPPEALKNNVPHQALEMKAERYEFIPDTVRVKVGTLVQIAITAIDGTHGFELSAFGIDERQDEHETKTIEFFASQRGVYGFRCSHFCGLGHLGMTGTIIIE